MRQVNVKVDSVEFLTLQVRYALAKEVKKRFGNRAKAVVPVIEDDGPGYDDESDAHSTVGWFWHDEGSSDFEGEFEVLDSDGAIIGKIDAGSLGVSSIDGEEYATIDDSFDINGQDLVLVEMTTDEFARLNYPQPASPQYRELTDAEAETILQRRKQAPSHDEAVARMKKEYGLTATRMARTSNWEYDDEGYDGRSHTVVWYKDSPPKSFVGNLPYRHEAPPDENVFEVDESKVTPEPPKLFVLAESQ